VGYLAQFLDAQFLIELWFVRGEFSRTVCGVCAAGLDSGSSFGNVVCSAAFALGKMQVFLVSAT